MLAPDRSESSYFHHHEYQRPETEDDCADPRFVDDGAVQVIALRWTLGLIIVVLGGGFFVLTTVASGFRKSFGASELNPLLQIVPIAAMLVLLAGVIAPSNRILLHVGAVCAVAMMGYCIWTMIFESAEVVWLGLIYMAVWLYFYWRSIGSATTP